MKQLRKKFFIACEDAGKTNTYKVEKMTQPMFNKAYEQAMKNVWVFIKKNFVPKEKLK